MVFDDGQAVLSPIQCQSMYCHFKPLLFTRISWKHPSFSSQ